MKPNHIYRVVDVDNGFDISVVATSVSNAAYLARKRIARQRRDKFLPWVTDDNTGGWKGVYIDLPECRHVQVPPPNPKPAPRKLPWKRQMAAA
jgi:hypothetical protein